MLFIPRKNTIEDLTQLFTNNENIKIIPLTTQKKSGEIENIQPKKINKEEHIQHKKNNKEEYIQDTASSPSVKKTIKEKHKKKERKSRKRSIAD